MQKQTSCRLHSGRGGGSASSGNGGRKAASTHKRNACRPRVRLGRTSVTIRCSGMLRATSPGCSGSAATVTSTSRPSRSTVASFTRCAGAWLSCSVERG